MGAWAFAAHGEDPFTIRAIESSGRTVLANLVDLDGDGRGDLLTVVFSGVPPNESRQMRVYYQRPDGSLPPEPDERDAVPAGVAAYDLAELEPERGVELLLLQREGITVQGFRDRIPRRRELAIPAPPLLALAADERGLDRLRLARSDLGGPLRLVAPGLGECVVLDPIGRVLGRLGVGVRVNYLVPPRPGPLISESEMEAYVDFPRMGVGDVDGDGRPDLVASSRHELRVFLQREDGRFRRAPDRTLALGLIRETDHIRASGTVRSELGDLDGDGRTDLVISSKSGGFFDAESEIRIYLNRGSGWDLKAPDQRFRGKGSVTTLQLIDLDADGRPELLDASLRVSVLGFVDLLLTRSLDIRARVFRAGKSGRFETKPWLERSFGVGLNFDTFRPSGFVPTLDGDLNGDGYPDLLASGDGEALEIFLGGPEHRFRKRVARQELATSGRVRFGDYDADDLPDFVIYDPRAIGKPVVVGLNRGVLPDTRRVPELVPAPPVPRVGSPPGDALHSADEESVR